MLKLTQWSIICLLIINCTHNKQTDHKDFSLQNIVGMNHRSEKNKNRDKYRNPIETLKFFEVKPDMKVVEISPATGWYTEILAPYLKDRGQLYAAVFTEDTQRDLYKRFNKTLKEKISKHPDIYGDVNYTVFEAPDHIGPIAPKANSVDRVLTFRNIHNWMKVGALDEALKEFYRVLKPGGILGIVEHRQSPDRKQDPKALSGYVRQDYMIEKAKEAGFKLVASSEINANPKDDSLHPKGVWTLPPSLRLGEKNKDKYLNIGESDRMTLKFVKESQL